MQRIYTLLIAILLLSVNHLVAQNQFAIQNFKIDSTIPSSEINEFIDSAKIHQLIYKLSSAEFEGRESGEEGQKKAVQFIIDEFKSNQIPSYNNTYIQEIPLINIDKRKLYLIKGKDTLFSKINIAPHYVFKNLKQENITTVFAGYGIEEENYSDYKDINITNSWVAILNENPTINDVTLKNSWSLDKKIALAKSKGAIGVFVIYNQKPSLYYPIKYQSLAENENHEDFPVISIHKKDFISFFLKKESKKLLKKKIKSFVVKEEVSVKSEMITKVFSENVFAFFPGSENPEEIIVLSAHYDHLGKIGKDIYYGADDNATGTTALIQIAKTLQKAKQNGFTHKRSILILLVSGEEKGLLGSEYYAKHPVFPIKNTLANINVDMIGRNDANHKNNDNYIYVIDGNMQKNFELRTINEQLNSTYFDFELDYRFSSSNHNEQLFYRSDHYNFFKKGVPSLFFFSGIHKDYHTTEDTADKINAMKTTNISTHIFLLVWELSNNISLLEK